VASWGLAVAMAAAASQSDCASSVLLKGPAYDLF
jgi:hypothetical protein